MYFPINITINLKYNNTLDKAIQINIVYTYRDLILISVCKYLVIHKFTKH